MKKKLILFFLCFTLLFTVACSGKEQPQSTPTPAPTATTAPTNTPAPSPTPANAAKEALDNLQTAWDSLLNWSGTGNVDVTKGFGYDVTIDISVNQLLMSLLGMADLSSLNIALSMDMNNELLAADMTLNLNEDELLNMIMFFDHERLLYNFPKYSSQYAGIETGAEPGSPVAIPNTEELLSMYKDIVDNLFGAFKAQEGFIDNVTLEKGGYKVTGQKFTATATVDDLNAALNSFASTVQEMYPDMEMEIPQIPADEMTEFIFNVYKGADASFAWELYPDTSAGEPIGLISAENGFCLFITTDGTTELLLRSEKSSSLEGTVYFPNDSEGLSLNYTLSDNNITLSDAEDTISVSFGWQFSDEYISLDLSLLTEEIGLTYNIVADGKKSHMDMALLSYDTKLLTLSADYTIRDFNQVTVPESYLDEETWETQADTDALLADMVALLEKYPVLESLFGTTEEPDVDYGDDWEDYPEYDPTTAYDNDFMHMTGYYADENGDVYFEPSELEVLGLGIPSTGLYYTEITADQRQTLITYVNSAFANDYEQSGSLYLVYGNVYDNSVVSQYYTQYRATDNTNGYNVSDLFIEIITGHFIEANLYRASREDAFAAANELLAILGENETLDSSLDETSLYEGVWIGNFIIYGVDYGEYYRISIY